MKRMLFTGREKHFGKNARPLQGKWWCGASRPAVSGDRRSKGCAEAGTEVAEVGEGTAPLCLEDEVLVVVLVAAGR